MTPVNRIHRFYSDTNSIVVCPSIAIISHLLEFNQMAFSTYFCKCLAYYFFSLPRCKKCAAMHAHSLEGTLPVCDDDNGSPLYCWTNMVQLRDVCTWFWETVTTSWLLSPTMHHTMDVHQLVTPFFLSCLLDMPFLFTYIVILFYFFILIFVVVVVAVCFFCFFLLFIVITHI